MTTDKTYIEKFTITYDPHSETEEAEANKVMADEKLDFISRKCVRGQMILVAQREVMPFDCAIDRLMAMAAELDPQIIAEQDLKKRTILTKERLTCSDAASFLLNDSE